METLEDNGFELNPYDSCVANKMINGKQCTVLFHVDDLKISHVDENVVTSIIKIIDDTYGKYKPLTMTRGKVHEYLGMTIDFSVPGKVKIIMIDYVKKMIKDLPEWMIGTAITPAASYLFEVNENCEKLPKDLAELFHHLTAQGLFLCKRGRPDIQTAIAFLTTRVREPDQDDMKKLTRMMKYLQGSEDLYLTLEADDTHVIKWFVDGSFAVHRDMKSHTGSAMFMGKGAVYSSSSKQKLNTRSSTEAELVAVNDVMGQVLWTRLFLEAQGYEVTDSKLYQDNLSAMLLEQNGRASSGKNTRHIDIRYFFIHDRIEKGDVSIGHCPTADMIGDFGTKPTQGALFRKFRKAILNLDD